MMFLWDPLKDLIQSSWLYILRGAPSSLVVEWVLLVTLNILERRAVRVKQESETDDRISYLINIHGGRRRRAGF